MLSNVVDRSFVLVQAAAPAGAAGRLIGRLLREPPRIERGPAERLSPTHVIVVRAGSRATPGGAAGDADDAYYLFAAPEAQRLLEADASGPVGTALGLARRQAEPVLDAEEDELAAPPRAVVVDRGRVIGFVDATAPPPTLAGSRQGLWPDGSVAFEAAEPAPRGLVAEFPARITLGETASLIVLLSATAPAGSLPVVLPVGSSVDVVVSPRSGFELVGPREGSLTLTEAAETPPLQFKLKATAVGLGVVRLYVFSAGRSLGPVTLEAQVDDAADAGGAAGGAPAEPVRQERTLPAAGGPPPDLSLLILEETVDGRPCLTFTLKTREPYESPRIEQRYGPVPLRLDPQQHFRSFFAQIQDAPEADAPDPGALDRLLARKGADLFRALIPADLQAVLWALRERISSVQLQSAESWIPWELCALQGRENGRIVEGPPFCQAFAMTRWLPEVADKPVLRLSRIGLVVPAGSGLTHAPEEAAFLHGLATGERRVESVGATKEALLTALQSGDYDGWHFVCHGSASDGNPDRAELELEGPEPLRPEDLSGVVENVGLARPLVFLNACQSGRGGLALTGVGGWAERFLRAAVSEGYREYGAAAFVGTYWKIDDRAALEFARAFYTALLRGRQTIGEAARTARLAVRTLGDSSWAAYTVFGHPLARVA